MIDSRISQPEDLTMPSDESDSSSISLILPSDLMPDNMDASLSHRRDQVSETLEEKVCKFFMELNSTEPAAAPDPTEFDLYNGVVFRVQTNQLGVEIKTLELDLKDFETTQVRIFTKLGDYNRTGLFDDPDSWEQVTTDTAFAVASNERTRTIIPADQFQPIVMEPKESRLIYVALPSDAPLVKSADIGVSFDDIAASSDELESHVGYAINGAEYFGTPVESRAFFGAVHYEVKLPCENQRTALTMELPYFVDQPDPAAAVLRMTTDAMNKAITHAMSVDAKLIRMQNIDGLIFNPGTTETYQVAHEGKCPFSWQECAKVMIKLHFKHDKRLNSGIVQYEILKFATEYNVTEDPFKLGYVGKMPLALNYYITLVGAPKSFEFDEIQEEYYGRQTTAFLAKMTGEDILAAGLAPGKRNAPIRSSSVNDDASSEGSVISVVEEGETDGDGSNEKGLRHNQRRLQQSTTSAAKLHTAIYGAYPAWPAPQHPHSERGVDSMATVEILQTAFDENGTVFVEYLKDGLLQPGPVNDDGRAEFFSDITGSDAELDEKSLWMPTAAPTPAPTFDPNQEEEILGMPKSTLEILGILALVVGCLLFLFTIYWEFQQRQSEKEKLKRNARAAQRKVDKLRAEHYRRIAEKKRRIQDGSDVDQDEFSLTEPMIA